MSACTLHLENSIKKRIRKMDVENVPYDTVDARFSSSRNVSIVV